MVIGAVFRHAVERLAATAEQQEAYLRELGTAPSADELALEFSDAVDRENLDEATRAAVQQLDRYISEISGLEHTELWTVGALYTSPEWAHIRLLAMEVVSAMTE